MAEVRNNTLNRIDFDNKGFEDLAFQNDNASFLLEKSIFCPCRTDINNSPRTDCDNCQGSGWLFTDPILIHGFVQSMNFDQKFNMDQPEVASTAMFTLSEVNDAKLDYFDRLTMQQGTGNVQNNIAKFTIKQNEFKKNVFQLYVPFKIVSVEKLIIEIDTKIVILSYSDYKVNENTNTINLSNILYEKYYLKQNISEITCSIRYRRPAIYYVLSKQHRARQTKKVENGKEIDVLLPLQYMIREHNFFVPNTFTV